jgi:DNA-binding transcriptional LysR family regulator
VDLDLRLVRYFVVVAEELHFGRAAARLHISQPALSKQIRKLEDQLGAPLLVRDSRHVTLTERGTRVLADARQLLDLSQRMQYEAQPNAVRIAHIFELSTSRVLADEFTGSWPQVQVVQRNLDGIRQLDALLGNRLDVAILRVTAQMVAEHPTGWRHRFLRLEPFFLVGRTGDLPRATASLYERPLEVFADAPASGQYNAHGQYMKAFEKRAGLTMSWLGNPGTFTNCLPVIRRASTPGFLFEFESHAVRYADEGLPVHHPLEFQPYYPWSIAWRDEPPNEPVSHLLEVAERTARARNWRQPSRAGDTPGWVPPDDPLDGVLPAL